MTKSKKNLAIMVALITLFVALGSIFATFGVFTMSTKTVEATETRAPGLYNGSTFTPWADLISSGKISTDGGHLRVAESGKDMAGELVCGSVDGLTDLMEAFMHCNKLTSIDLSNLNTNNVESISSLFAGCSSLKNIIFGNINTENVKFMGGVFIGCSSLKNLDLSNFNTSNASMFMQMFMGCSFETLTLGNNFVIKSGSITQMMFASLEMLFDEETLRKCKTPEDRLKTMFSEEEIADFKESGEYETYLAMASDSTINTIVCPQVADDVAVALAPASNHFYALADDPDKKEVTELSSTTNGKTLKLYYRDTKTEVPPISSPDTPSETGVVADISMIIIALASILSLASVATKKKRLAR